VDENTKITNRRARQTACRKVAAELRQLLPRRTLQSKGVKYADEKIQRKVGKTVPVIDFLARAKPVAAPTMQHAKKRKLRQLRRWRIRKKVSGTGDRPRMSVHFSNEHIYVQFIDDAKGITLASASTRTNPPLAGSNWRPMSKAPKKSAPRPPRRQRARASRRSSSTATAPLITAKSRPWAKRPVRQA